MQQEARHRWAPALTRNSPTTSTTIVETLDSYPQYSSSSSFYLPLSIMPNGRDRTSEFQTTVKTFASRQVSHHENEELIEFH